MMVGSSGLDPWVSSLCQSVSSFAAGVDILPDRSRSGRYLAESIESRLDLAGFGGFQVTLRRKSKNIAGICKFLSKNL